MQQKKSLGFGFRGWMLMLYQATGFLAYTIFTNWPLNILADMYGGAQTLSTIYTVGAVVGVAVQLILANYIGKIKNIKMFGTILGLITILLGLGIMLVPAGTVWLIIYGLANVITIMYGTFSLGILVGQWFPTRKGTVMGIATLAFPITNGLIGVFASNVFAKGYPDVFSAFLPFLIVVVIGWIIGIIFIKDYPEQCGCYRDNDRSLTPEIANKMMLAEIDNKKTTVWKLGHVLSNRDFWFITVPMGLLLFMSVGLMTQTATIIGVFEEDLQGLGGYQGVMLMICIAGCIGSYILGLLDTKFGTKKSIIIACCIMALAGIFGMIQTAGTLVVALILLAFFMGAASNYTVSASAQYWRREDFSSVFAVVNPVANIICSVGPMVIAQVLFANPANILGGCRNLFIITLIAGIVSIILMLLFSSKHVKEVDDKYRKAAGKPLDDALVGRK